MDPQSHRLKIPDAREADQRGELFRPISGWVAPQSEAETPLNHSVVWGEQRENTLPLCLLTVGKKYVVHLYLPALKPWDQEEL